MIFISVPHPHRTGSKFHQTCKLMVTWRCTLLSCWHWLNFNNSITLSQFTILRSRKWNFILNYTQILGGLFFCKCCVSDCTFLIHKIWVPSSVTGLFTKRLDDGRSEATCKRRINNILHTGRALNDLFGFERKQTTYLMISTNGKLFINPLAPNDIYLCRAVSPLNGRKAIEVDRGGI